MIAELRPSGPVKVGISSCLLGNEVRYDGMGAKSSWPHAALESLFSPIATCPEMSIGLGVPRPPIRLVEEDQVIRVERIDDSSFEVSQDLKNHAQKFVAQHPDMAGYIFMHKSPSCGVHRVKVYDRRGGMPERRGRGVFAQAVVDHRPTLPIEDGPRLFDDKLCDLFVTRAYAHAHWLAMLEVLEAKALVEFHSMYKYLLMAHSPSAYRTCGRIVSKLKGVDLDVVATQYGEHFFSGLAEQPTQGTHANVLSHLHGYFKKALDSASRQELARLIDAYRVGEEPLLAPLALLRHHLLKYPNEYVEMQVYLDPHPGRALRRRL